MTSSSVELVTTSCTAEKGMIIYMVDRAQMCSKEVLAQETLLNTLIPRMPAVVVRLHDGFAQGGYAEGDTLDSIENLARF